MIGGILDLLLAPQRGTLPVQLMLVGLGVLLAAGVVRALQPITTRRSLLVGSLLLTSGYWLTALSVLRGSYNLYAAYLYFSFQAIEGMATAHFYRKVAGMLRGRSFPGGTGMQAHALHLAAVFSVVLAGVGVLLYRLESGTGATWEGPVTLTYTSVVLGVTVLGVWWRIRPLRNEYRVPTLLGFTACVTGAELYGYASVSLDVVVLLGGSVTHVLGFWLAVGIWIVRGHWLP